MSKKTLFIAIFLFISILGLSGCDPTLPICDSGSLMAPDLVYPDWREIVNRSTVELEWSYPDSSCEPEEYEIILSRERDFSVIEITDTVDGSENTYTPSGLVIAEEYFWRVAAKVGSTTGSYSHELRSFFTEPVCDPGDLVAPTLVLPVNGGIFDRGYDSLEWEWPLTTCIPESYKVEVSMDPDFVDNTYFGGTGSPGTRWGFGSTPPDGTQFWWRIAAYADEVQGPFSIIKTFTTDPVCTGGSLVPPELLSPADGDMLTTGTPRFTWSYPHFCAPEGVNLQVFDSPDMWPPVLEVLETTMSLRDFQSGIPLNDCTTHYWRVAMISEGIVGDYSEERSFTVDMSGDCTCDPDDISLLRPVSPDFDEIVPDLNPTLEWLNLGECFPEGYAIYLSPTRDFSDTSLNDEISGYSVTSYSPPIALEGVTRYYWKVAGVVDSTVGEPTHYSTFFTGPGCTSVAELFAPELLSPLDGEVVTTLTPRLEYSKSSLDCLPDGYNIDLQTDSFFGGVNLMGEIRAPVTLVSPASHLTDCSLYFWKVEGIQDGMYGPESDVGWFYTNESGTCPSAPSPGTAKSNTFCREGTFPKHWPDAIHLFMEGDFMWVIAQNPFSTYLEVLIPDLEKKIPIKPYKSCWILKDAVQMWAEAPELPVAYPPPTPTPPPLVCNANLGKADCEASGGTYFIQNQYCQCP